MDKIKIPANQRLWETVYDGLGKPKWFITSDEARTKYHLYFCGEEKPRKVKTAASPGEFYEIIRGKS